MPQLMISLDPKIFDASSAAAKRMVEYGKTDEQFIVIPCKEKKQLDLSATVHVYGSGGNSKPIQFFKLCSLAHRLAREKKISSVTTQDPFYAGLIGYDVAKTLRIPFEVQVHGDFFGSKYYRRGLVRIIKVWGAKYVVRHATSIRTVGERVTQSLVALGIVPEKINVRPVALNTSEPPAVTVLHDQKIFVWVGRMEAEKNLPFLVNTFKKVHEKKSEAKLVLVGEGSERKKIEDQVSALGLQGVVTFAGWLSSPIQYIKNAAALLLPSLTESYAAVAMEAYAVGTPVIMSDVGVANYELKPGPRVTILPVNDKDAWVKAILNV